MCSEGDTSRRKAESRSGAMGGKRVCHRDGKRVEVADRCDGFRCIDFPRDDRPSMLPKTVLEEHFDNKPLAVVVKKETHNLSNLS